MLLLRGGPISTGWNSTAAAIVQTSGGAKDLPPSVAEAYINLSKNVAETRKALLEQQIVEAGDLALAHDRLQSLAAAAEVAALAGLIEYGGEVGRRPPAEEGA